MTNGSVSKRDISAENDDLSDRQGQPRMKWEQISHLKYHEGKPGKFTVQLSTLKPVKKRKFLNFCTLSR